MLLRNLCVIPYDPMNLLEVNQSLAAAIYVVVILFGPL